jgi:hypothetical protein
MSCKDSKDKIDNMKSILKNNSKYYMFIDLGGNKKQLLSNGDSKKTVEKEAKYKIMQITNNNIKTLLKLHDKQFVYLFNLRKPNKEEIDRDNNSIDKKIRIGGKIGLIVDSYKTIINEDSSNPIKFKNLNKDGHGLLDKYWIDDKYLKKYDEIEMNHIKRILYVIDHGSPFAVRIISDVIKKKTPLYLTT